MVWVIARVRDALQFLGVSRSDHISNIFTSANENIHVFEIVVESGSNYESI